MGNSTLPKILLVVLVSLSVSCNRQDFEGDPLTPEEETLQALTIEDARALFSEYEQTFTLSAGSLTRSNFGGVNPYLDFIDWNTARESSLVTYPVVEIPTPEIKAAFYISGQQPQREATEDFLSNAKACLIAGLDSWGEPYFRMLYVVPDDEFLCRRGLLLESLTLRDIEQEFTGSLRLYDMEGCFVKGYVLDNGLVMAMMYPAGYSGDYSPGEDYDRSEEEPQVETDDGVSLSRAANNESCYIQQGGILLPEFQVCSNVDNTDIAYCINYEDVPVTYAVCDAGNGIGEDNYYAEGGLLAGIKPETPGDIGGGGGGNKGNGNGDKKDGDQEDEGQEEEEEEEEEPGEPCPQCGKYPCQCCDICGEYPCTCLESSDPCDNLRKKANDPNFVMTLDELNTYTAAGVQVEYGYTYVANENGSYDFSNLIHGSTTSQSVNLTDSNQSVFDGFIHTHYPGCGNIFSFGDLAVPLLVEYTGRTRNLTSFTFGVVTPKGTYFLMVEDYEMYKKFWNFSYMMVNGEVYNTSIGEYRENYFNVNNIHDNIESFTQFLSEYNTGLTVMVQNNRGEFNEYNWNANSGRITIKLCGMTIGI
ncbi:MAG: DUF5004 domain-containing protein [Rikenellaceae bacterium]|nr:DUF5004 domain-containing protein [Rikenellaceae bacterium]